MVNPVFSSLGITIFETMSKLAGETNAINLGQGFPEALEPRPLIEAAIAALRNGSHQYPPMPGLPVLRLAVAANARRFFNIEADWETEILVTSGATEALADSFLALINHGDEVIILEPAYDAYSPLIRRAGGVVVPVRLSPPHWHLPQQALCDAITPRTRLIVVNNPMNPIGKVFTREELDFIAELAVKHNLIIVADEVYEHLVFAGNRHISLFSLPEIRNRVVRIGSAGKSFSLTGWKVGYITADAGLLKIIARAHQYITFTTPPALQAAVAAGLNLPDSYFQNLREELAQRRDYLVNGLRDAGFNTTTAQATYFLVADISDLDRNSDDLAFSQRLTREAGVTPVPVSAFYSKRDVTSHIRFCFAKKPDTLEEAIERLRRWRDEKYRKTR